MNGGPGPRGHPGRAAADEALTVRTESEEETLAFGARLAGLLGAGDLVGLSGELGSGKTALVRGIAAGLGVPAGRVRSPTFTLINEYGSGRLPLYHVDLYRLEPTEFDRLALREYLDGDGVCVVEWYERLGEELPRLAVRLEVEGPEARRLVVWATDARYNRVLEQLRRP